MVEARVICEGHEGMTPSLLLLAKLLQGST